VDPTLITLAPTAIDNLYHVGYLVPDLLAAMDTFGRHLQCTWATPFQMGTGFETADGGTDDRVGRFAYSKEGPPFLELIEVIADPASIFAEPSGGGFHHVGVYAERWRDETARLTDAGMEIERIGAGLAFVRDPDTGFRIEVVSFKGRPFLDRILSGELGAECPLT
jgi:catechol 2,3-dioxygenase-like lactoylglutathione lyase family enzyme